MLLDEHWWQVVIKPYGLLSKRRINVLIDVFRLETKENVNKIKPRMVIFFRDNKLPTVLKSGDFLGDPYRLFSVNRIPQTSVCNGCRILPAGFFFIYASSRLFPILGIIVIL